MNRIDFEFDGDDHDHDFCAISIFTRELVLLRLKAKTL